MMTSLIPIHGAADLKATCTDKQGTTMDWKEENGVSHAELLTNFNASGKVLAVIYPPNLHHDKYVLSINGYRFTHESLEEAKDDAKERVAINSGIYLLYYS